MPLSTLETSRLCWTLFDDAAQVKIPPDLYIGSAQIRNWASYLAANHYASEPGLRHLSRDSITWPAEVRSDQLARFGLASLNGEATLTVRGGKIAAYTFVLTREAAGLLRAAQIAASDVLQDPLVVGTDLANVYGPNDVFRGTDGTLVSYRDLIGAEPGSGPYFDLGGEPVVLRTGLEQRAYTRAMSSLLERLSADLKDAMRAGDAMRRDEIRGLISVLKAEQQSKLTRTLSKQGLILHGDNAVISDEQQTEIDRLRATVALSDDEAQAVLVQRVKQHRQSIDGFRQGKRDDLVQVEEAQLAIDEAYLPEQADAALVDEAVQTAIRESGAQTARDQGKVMALLSARLRGRADMKAVSARVQALLAQSSNASL